ncbi:MAG: hypothetical protein IKV39_01635, partial [Clostridia bacterium]|nr:hypothetical protein [Clostridia bacterium]
MRFGVCASLDKLPEIIEAGYDFVEVRVSEFANMTDEEFKDYDENLKKSGIKLECFNVFFSPPVRLTGPDVDYDFISEYVEKVSKRMAALGADLVVLGSGSCRKVPEGFDFNEARAQFEKV